MRKYVLLLALLLTLTADARIRCRRRSRGGSRGGSSLRWNFPSTNDMLTDQVKQTELQQKLLVQQRNLERTKESIEHEKKIERLRRQQEILQYEKKIRELKKK